MVLIRCTRAVRGRERYHLATVAAETTYSLLELEAQQEEPDLDEMMRRMRLAQAFIFAKRLTVFTIGFMRALLVPSITQPWVFRTAKRCLDKRYPLVSGRNAPIPSQAGCCHYNLPGQYSFRAEGSQLAISPQVYTPELPPQEPHLLRGSHFQPAQPHPRYEPSARIVCQGIAASSDCPVNDHQPVAGHDDVIWVKVVVTQTLPSRQSTQQIQHSAPSRIL